MLAQGRSLSRTVDVASRAVRQRSPLIGKSFVIGPKGATLGRRNTNDISLNLKSRADGSQDMVPVDTAVSAEHAHIVMDGSSGASTSTTATERARRVAPTALGTG